MKNQANKHVQELTDHSQLGEFNPEPVYKYFDEHGALCTAKSLNDAYNRLVDYMVMDENTINGVSCVNTLYAVRALRDAILKGAGAIDLTNA